MFRGGCRLDKTNPLQIQVVEGGKGKGELAALVGFSF